MNALMPVPEQTAVALTDLIDRASRALAGARNAAEVLEARDMASVAYDAAKKAARLGKAKQAHDDLIAAAYRAQADALEIEAGAKRRLADEYDAAQERGEVATDGRPKTVPCENGIAAKCDCAATFGDNLPRGRERSKCDRPSTAADIGISRKEIHEARIIRDAEVAQPGIVRQTIDEALVKGEEPTKADVKRAALRVIKGDAETKPRKPAGRYQRPAPVVHTQHDRDLTMILGVWDATCGTAQAAFLETVCTEHKLRERN